MSLFETTNSKLKKNLPEEESINISRYYDIKKGDIYLLGNHRLMCGDATNKEDVYRLINNSKINLVLTDPPYGINIVQNNAVGGSKPTTFKGHIGSSVICKVNNYMPIKGDETTETAKLNFEIIKKISENQILFGGNYFTDFLNPSPCWIIWDKKNRRK